MSYFNISDFSHTIDNQIDELQEETDEISQATFDWPAWLR